MDIGLLLIHTVVGLLVAAHGSQKLLGWLGGQGLEGTARYLESLGLVPGKPLAAAAGASELIGGLLLAAGFLTPAAAALVAAPMVVAARTQHANRGPWIVEGGWEYVLTVGTVAIGLAFNGPGRWSLDGVLGWQLSGLWSGLGATAVAVAGGGAVLAAVRRSRTSSSSAGATTIAGNA
jgi:putative oxidoreductase